LKNHRLRNVLDLIKGSDQVFFLFEVDELGTALPTLPDEMVRKARHGAGLNAWIPIF